MSEEKPEDQGTELFVSVTPELNAAGEVMVKFAFFSENFALAVRVPPGFATQVVDGMRDSTYKLVRDIELAAKQSEAGNKPQLEVVRSIPDALRNSAHKHRLEGR